MTKYTRSVFGRWLATNVVGLLICGTAACGDPAGDDSQGIPPGSMMPGTDPNPPPTNPQLPVAAPFGPPPISGGTLLITQDDTLAVASDPDYDTVWFAKLDPKMDGRDLNFVYLGSGAEPGRLVEDQDGNVHVALRHGGQVAKLNPHSSELLSRTSVCPAPRGLAYDSTTGNLHVACAGGELVTLEARTGNLVRSLRLDTDLRDVLVKGNHLLVSRFRAAELLEVDESGTIITRLKPPQQPASGPGGATNTFSATTALRLLAVPGGEALLLHQWALNNAIPTHVPGAYGSSSTGNSCPSTPRQSLAIVNSGISRYNVASSDPASLGQTNLLASGGGPPWFLRDAAVSRDGQTLAVVGRGAFVINQNAMTISAGGINLAATYSKTALGSLKGCDSLGSISAPSIPTFAATNNSNNLQPDVVAVAIDGKNNVWVQTRDPGRIGSLQGSLLVEYGYGSSGSFSIGEAHRMFHTPTVAGIACASCHPEGGDDGFTWSFDVGDLRRSMSLRGGFKATAPFHWPGDLADFPTLALTIFGRMQLGYQLEAPRIDKLATWLDQLPLVPGSLPRDPDAVARGQKLFNDSSVGCASCHSGPHFSNNQTVDVGTGGAFQVPPLLELVQRAPYMHDGCAAKLRDRFSSTCGGGDRHGSTSHLSSQQLDDLVAYLETL